MTIPTIRFKPDGVVRKRFFHPDSFQHPAKMACGLVLECLERYSQPGDWVLDPMAGSGTLLLGAMYGRNLILNEMEPHFISPMLKSWVKIQQNGPALGYTMGQVLILQGDARALPLQGADCVITLPPFETVEPWQDKSFAMNDGRLEPRRGATSSGYTRPALIATSPPYEAALGHQGGTGPLGTSILRADYEAQKERLHFEPGYTRPALIATSPPYEGCVEQHKEGLPAYYQGEQCGGPNSMARRRGYTRPALIATSPPFGEALSGGGIAAAMAGKGDYDVTTKMPGSVYAPESHGQGAGNIGNERGQKYWDSMKIVYAECLRVLRPGGIMALVLKGFTRTERRKTAPKDAGGWKRDIETLRFCACGHLEEEHISRCQTCDCAEFSLEREEEVDNGWIKGGYVDLPGQTEAILLEMGWVKHDHWRRELWGLSFWRILQKRKSPDTFDDRLNYEEVLAFKKPEEA